MLFSWLKIRAARRASALRLYQTALAQSRLQVFYADLGVSDSMDGRFDVLSLHATLIMERLEACGPEGRKLAQKFFDVLFKQMELSLREAGVGDLGVPKYMKKMMKAFNGRAYTYHAAMANHDHNEMEQAVARNVYRTDAADIPEGAKIIAYYMKKSHEALRNVPLEDFENGVVPFAPVESKEQRKARHG